MNGGTTTSSISTNTAKISGDVTGTIDDTMKSNIETTIKTLLATKLQIDQSLITLSTEVRINDDGTNTFITTVYVPVSSSLSSGVTEQAFDYAIKSMNQGEVTASLQAQGIPAKDATIQDENPQSLSVKFFVSLLLVLLVIII